MKKAARIQFVNAHGRKDFRLVRLDKPNNLGRNQRKIRKRLRQVPQMRNSKKFR